MMTTNKLPCFLTISKTLDEGGGWEEGKGEGGGGQSSSSSIVYPVRDAWVTRLFITNFLSLSKALFTPATR